MTLYLSKALSTLCASITLCAIGTPFQAQAMNASLNIQADTVEQSNDPHRLTGTNISLWSRIHIVENETFQDYIRDWAPKTIRMPGGSWSNEYYWNGNGVRIGPEHEIENFDTSKQNADGTWEIDYSGYAPGFRLHGEERHLSDYHGDLDVKMQHEWIQGLGSNSMVTVNVGSGTPHVAAEWVKWANQANDYNVGYWEIGNELNGDWELGHRLPDGSSMTGTVYAQRFHEFSQAMRAVDSNIQLGGPACSDLSLAFVEELIRDGGDALDFVSIHAYPVGVRPQPNSNKFAAIQDVRDAVQRINQWIKQYQPTRVDDIEIGITEWNIKVNEDRDTADLINGLWSALWIGALFEEGVDFANQWDLTTYVEAGGHSAFYINEETTTVIPKSQYWALWMWNNLMGNDLVSSTIKGSDQVSSFVTRSDKGLQIMLVNTSESEDAHLTLNIDSKHSLSAIGQQHTLSSAEYFWDPHAHKPLWSLKPSVQPLDFAKSTQVTVPKFSLSVIEIPFQGANLQAVEAPQPIKQNQLQLRMPERIPADAPIDAWIVALDADAPRPALAHDEPVQLSVSGPAKLSTKTVTLDNAAASFTIQPTAPGMLTLTARSAGLTTTHELECVALSERKHVHWTFDDPIPEWHAKGSYPLSADPSIKPNQYVAAATLDKVLPSKNNDLLFHFEPLPREELPFNNLVGIVGQLQAAHNLKCEDPRARVNIILQSDADHWMHLGSVPLKDMIGKWQDFELKAIKPEHIEAMSKLYAIRIQIDSLSPVTGDIYLDDLGFIFRTGL